ncbi:unnamed protein product [Trichogramma brassicae]|uniref:Uncharacterized protein n=1 Tax=Trichogramma brassicae TaxID=86971 RepID=A0A6H5I7X6_9HYME|nr:unnamed protein product [Trichogramma brassicae]
MRARANDPSAVHNMTYAAIIRDSPPPPPHITSSRPVLYASLYNRSLKNSEEKKLNLTKCYPRVIHRPIETLRKLLRQKHSGAARAEHIISRGSDHPDETPRHAMRAQRLYITMANEIFLQNSQLARYTFYKYNVTSKESVLYAAHGHADRSWQSRIMRICKYECSYTIYAFLYGLNVNAQAVYTFGKLEIACKTFTTRAFTSVMTGGSAGASSTTTSTDTARICKGAASVRFLEFDSTGQAPDKTSSSRVRNIQVSQCFQVLELLFRVN